MKIGKKKLKILAYLTIAFLALSAGAFLLSKLVNNTAVKEIVEDLGLFGPVFLMIGIVFGGVYAPMTHLPFTMASLALYGFWKTYLILFIGNAIIAPTINFHISRKWGRCVVEKLAGQKSVKKIDELTSLAGWESLIPLRLFGGALYDLISYAAGLTNIRFKTFLIITIIFTQPGGFIMLKLLEKGVEGRPLPFGIMVLWSYAAATLTPYLIYRFKKQKALRGGAPKA